MGRVSPESRDFIEKLKRAEDINVFMREYNNAEEIDAAAEIAQYLFVEAMQWRDAAAVLKNAKRKSLDSQIGICLCFSCELFMKTIWVEEKNDLSFVHKEKHNLSNLFRGLSVNVQKSIKNGINPDKNVFKNFDERISFEMFEDELNYISNDFLELRYEFEKFIVGENIVLANKFLARLNDNLEKTARKIIDED